MKLYEISQALREVIDGGFAVDAETGEVFDSDNLDQLNETFEDKLEACAIVCKEMQAEADALKAEADALAKRSKAAQNRVEGLKAYMLRQMQDSGSDGLKTPRAVVKVRRSSYVDVLDAAAVPDEFQETVVTAKPDKRGIMRAIKAGETVPGAELKTRESLAVS